MSPRVGWVLARAFSPQHANTALAAAAWVPWTGQLVAARCYRSPAVWDDGHARAVALMHASRRQPRSWAAPLAPQLCALADTQHVTLASS